MELLGVTQGLVHACPVAFPWERAAHWLPKSVLTRLPASGAPAPIPARQPSTRVWLALSHPPPHSTQWYLVAGTNHPVVVASRATATKSFKGREIVQVDFTHWPRGTPAPSLVARRRLNGHWAPEILGSIEMPVSPARVVTPLPLSPVPSTNAVPGQSWSVAVEGFQYGWALEPKHYLPTLETNPVPVVGSLRARMLSADPGDRRWFLIAVRRATNAAGDVLVPSWSQWLSLRPGLMLSPAPWPGDAWDLQLEFSRNGGFSADELVTLPPLFVDGPEVNPFGWRTNVHGIQLQIRSIGRGQGPPGEVFLKVDASQVPVGWNVSLVRVLDEAGTNCWSRPRGGALNATRMEFEFRLPPGQRVAHVTLAVHRSRMAEVTLEPTWAQ
jgi:hypothetical protein